MNSRNSYIRREGWIEQDILNGTLDIESCFLEDVFYKDVNMEQVEWIIDNLDGEDDKRIIASADSYSASPIHIAAEFVRDPEILKLMIKRLVCEDIGDYNSPYCQKLLTDNFGSSPLHYAARNFNLEVLQDVVDVLIEAGEDPMKEDNTGSSFLDRIDDRIKRLEDEIPVNDKHEDSLGKNVDIVLLGNVRDQVSNRIQNNPENKNPGETGQSPEPVVGGSP